MRSVLLLLRREANATNATGVLEFREHPEDPEPYLVFRYRVVRLWLEPLATFLEGPAALLPFAPLTDEAAADLSGAVERVIRRLRAETPPALAGKMETAAFVLAGLRYTSAVLLPIFARCQEMEESSTYQVILRRGEERGEARGVRETLLQIGGWKLGAPGPSTVAAVEAITDVGRLRALAARLRDANTWDELLAG